MPGGVPLDQGRRRKRRPARAGGDRELDPQAGPRHQGDAVKTRSERVAFDGLPADVRQAISQAMAERFIEQTFARIWALFMGAARRQMPFPVRVEVFDSRESPIMQVRCESAWCSIRLRLQTEKMIYEGKRLLLITRFVLVTRQDRV